MSHGDWQPREDLASEDLLRLLSRVPQGDATAGIAAAGTLAGFRRYLPWAPFARPYVYGAERAPWAIEAINQSGGGYPHPDVLKVRAGHHPGIEVPRHRRQLLADDGEMERAA